MHDRITAHKYTRVSHEKFTWSGKLNFKALRYNYQPNVKFPRNGTGSKGLNELRTKQDLAVLLTRKISMAPINPDLGVPLTRKISMAPTMYMDDATVVPR